VSTFQIQILIKLNRFRLFLKGEGTGYLSTFLTLPGREVRPLGWLGGGVERVWGRWSFPLFSHIPVVGARKWEGEGWP